jgi:hypothetical protein
VAGAGTVSIGLPFDSLKESIVLGHFFLHYHDVRSC